MLICMALSCVITGSSNIRIEATKDVYKLQDRVLGFDEQGSLELFD